MTDIEVINLFDIVKVSFSYKQYIVSERDIIDPALKEAGYKPLYSAISNGGHKLWYDTEEFYWWSSEKDSFGPLSRSTYAEDPSGKIVEIFYG